MRKLYKDGQVGVEMLLLIAARVGSVLLEAAEVRSTHFGGGTLTNLRARRGNFFDAPFVRDGASVCHCLFAHFTILNGRRLSIGEKFAMLT